MKRAWLPSSSVYQLLTTIFVCGVIASLAGRGPLAWHCCRSRISSSFNFVRAIVSDADLSPIVLVPLSVLFPHLGCGPAIEPDALNLGHVVVPGALPRSE